MNFPYTYNTVCMCVCVHVCVYVCACNLVFVCVGCVFVGHCVCAHVCVKHSCTAIMKIIVKRGVLLPTKSKEVSGNIIDTFRKFNTINEMF